MENSELITKALSYIRSETTKSDMTIEEVAAHAGFSTDHFNRVFFAHTGFTIMEYVRFSRLKKAARLLRVTNTDILNIALDCGYEAHESFSRAFKNQYGASPSEYRKQHEKTEVYYGDFFNDTIGARLLHEFKDLKMADSDEVIEYMLETDAIRYGYTAVCFRVNGGVALYSGEDFRDGFVWFTEWDGRFEGEIISDRWEKIAEYKKMFSDDWFTMVIYTLADSETIKDELAKYGVPVNRISRRQCTVYTGELYDITPPEGVSMRLITYEDRNLIPAYFARRFPDRDSNTPRLKHLEHELYQRDVLGNDQHSVFMFGIFKGGELIGVSDGGLQRTHGFVINNCVVTSLLAEYETEDVYQYAFKFVTNAALAKGALPIEDTQTPDTTEERYRSGRFNATELGYRHIWDTCILQ